MRSRLLRDKATWTSRQVEQVEWERGQQNEGWTDAEQLHGCKADLARVSRSLSPPKPSPMRICRGGGTKMSGDSSAVT